MINLNITKNQNFSLETVVKILFYTFPMAFILGNFVVTLQLLSFISFSLFLISKRQLKFRFSSSFWILFIFFSFFFINTAYQYLIPGLLNERVEEWPLEENPIFKSFMVIRFLLLILIIDTLFLNKILDIKKLFLFSLICTTFVSLDIFLQYITGSDLFGYKSIYKWNPGPFGNEMIGGSYLKNFSFISFFYFFTKHNDNNYNKFITVFLITLHLSAALVSGNRMPLILFLFGCVLIILLVKNFRFLMSISMVIFLIFFIFFTQKDSKIKDSYSNFLTAINIFKLIEIKNTDEEKIGKTVEKNKLPEKKFKLKKNLEGIIFLDNTGYNRIYRTSVALWKEKPIFGSGLKSFRIKCWEIIAKNYREINLHPGANEIQKLACSNHSHSYYFEILSEGGLVGLSLIILFFFMILKESFFYLKKYNQTLDMEIIFIIPIIISIFLEVWPLRSSGSFFTTWNATFFWLFVGIFLAWRRGKVTS